MKNRLLIYALFTVALAWASPSWALDACTGKGAEVFNLDRGLALEGYDPVSYFTEEAPLLGSPKIATEVCGVTYYFASELHRQKFLLSPGTYEPGFGGFNPYSMAFEAITDINPEIYDISTGRLLLFVNNGTRRRYLENPSVQDRAREYFSELLTEGF